MWTPRWRCPVTREPGVRYEGSEGFARRAPERHITPCAHGAGGRALWVAWAEGDRKTRRECNDGGSRAREPCTGAVHGIGPAFGASGGGALAPIRSHRWRQTRGGWAWHGARRCRWPCEHREGQSWAYSGLGHVGVGLSRTDTRNILSHMHRGPCLLRMLYASRVQALRSVDARHAPHGVSCLLVESTDP